MGELEYLGGLDGIWSRVCRYVGIYGDGFIDLFI